MFWSFNGNNDNWSLFSKYYFFDLWFFLNKLFQIEQIYCFLFSWEPYQNKKKCLKILDCKIGFASKNKLQSMSWRYLWFWTLLIFSISSEDDFQNLACRYFPQKSSLCISKNHSFSIRFFTIFFAKNQVAK